MVGLSSIFLYLFGIYSGLFILIQIFFHSHWHQLSLLPCPYCILLSCLLCFRVSNITITHFLNLEMRCVSFGTITTCLITMIERNLSAFLWLSHDEWLYAFVQLFFNFFYCYYYYYYSFCTKLFCTLSLNHLSLKHNSMLGIFGDTLFINASVQQYFPSIANGILHHE